MGDADILIPGRAPITSVGAFTTYANGAVVPTDTPAVAAATSAHLAARGTPALHTGLVAHYGYAGYPYAHYLGKREADSDADILIPGRAPITSDMQDTHMLTTLESVKPIAKLTQLSTSSEEPQSPLSVDLPLMLTELLSQLIPQLSPLPPLNILLPKELQSSMMSLSLPQSITDMLGTHMLTTLESVKPKVMLMLTTEFLDTDMVSNTSQLSHL